MAVSGWLSKHRLRVCDTVGGRLLVAQLGEFPSAEHDDGPELAMGISLAETPLVCRCDHAVFSRVRAVSIVSP